MVVEYRTASEGSWLSFFTVTPRIILKRRGSIIPKVAPQTLLAVAISVVARWWNPLAGSSKNVQSGLQMTGFLLSFLLVFKTHHAYQQFWTAYMQTKKLLECSRNLVMTACATFPCDVDPGQSSEALDAQPAPCMRLPTDSGRDVALDRFLERASLQACLPRLHSAGVTSLEVLRLVEEPDMVEAGLSPAERSVLHRLLRQERASREAGGAPVPAPVQRYLQQLSRLVALHYYVVVEYFRRSGTTRTSAAQQDSLRESIRLLASDREYAAIYPCEARGTHGSAARTAHANPQVVRHWVQTTIAACAAAHAIPAPIVASFTPGIAALSTACLNMDHIDKIQFPMPYAQVVKVLMLIFVFLLPWILQPSCGDLSELVVALCAMGLYGLDEVAEIMESPFGSDANHIDLEAFGQELLDDLELMCSSRPRQLENACAEREAAPWERLFDTRVRRSSFSSLMRAEIPPESVEWATRVSPLKIPPEDSPV